MRGFGSLLRVSCTRLSSPTYHRTDLSLLGSDRCWIRSLQSANQVVAKQTVAKLTQGEAEDASKPKKSRPPRPPKAAKEPMPEIPPPPKRIVAAAVLERLPVITPDSPPWELAMEELQARKNDATRMMMPKEWHQEAVEGADEEEDKDKVHLVISSRVTEADEKNDRKSLQRKLPRRLFLLVKGTDGTWQFPQSDRTEGETMRAAATRTLSTTCGSGLRAFWVGFCPMAHFDAGKDADMRRIFFYKTQYMGGDLALSQKHATDYVWVVREELKEYLPADLVPLAEQFCDD